MKPETSVVIGKNFGDEGKGLAVDYLCSPASGCMDSAGVLVVKHNGGAQAGHTVDLWEKRFVFHQLSAGSFRGASTYWADTYYPDLYKLREELVAFCKVCPHGRPRIYASPNTPVTLVDDVILNMAAETMRGEMRHGSCGMGIYEAFLRTEAGYGIRMKEVWESDPEHLFLQLKRIRDEYLPMRMKELGFETLPQEAKELLSKDDVLWNAAAEICICAEQVIPEEAPKEWLEKWKRVVFETGQGLLLDAENEPFWPHVTGSRTGLVNPTRFLSQRGMAVDRVIYVTRSYVTRHGAGPLPLEETPENLRITSEDRTNRENEWQGRLRYAWHPGGEDWFAPIRQDLKVASRSIGKAELLITHLNETDETVLVDHERVPIKQFAKVLLDSGIFSDILISDSPYAESVRSVNAR